MIIVNMDPGPAQCSLTSFSFVHLLYNKNVVTRSGNKAKIAVAPPNSQKSCLKYMNTRKRSITTAPKGRKTLYMVFLSFSLLTFTAKIAPILDYFEGPACLQ